MDSQLSPQPDDFEAPFQQKLRALYSPESRSYGQRLFLAASAILSIVFTVCFFGPFEIYQWNQTEFPFFRNDLVLYMGLLSLAVFIAGSLCCAVLKGKLFDGMISFLFALSVGFYLQGNVLNIELGTLNGAPVPWNDLTLHALGNLALWLVMIVSVFLVYYFSKKIWKNMVLFVSLLLVGVQLTSWVSLWITVPEKTDTIGLSMENEFRLSANKNVVVLVLDYFSGILVDEVQQAYPGALDDFADFTFFRNYSNAVQGTFPSLATMMTGKVFDPTIAHTDYFESAWASPQAQTLYDGLKAQNFERNFFFRIPYGAGVAQNLHDYCDNQMTKSSDIHPARLIKEMMFVSAYRYAPHALKPSFWITPEEISQIATMDVWVSNVSDDNYAFYRRLVDQKLEASNEQNVFVIYHISGVHLPYTINENVEEAVDAPTVSVARGALAIVQEYIAQMKELGVYDEATIIVAGDHGNIATGPSTFLMIKKPSETHEEIVVNQAPVAQVDFQPTLMDLADMDYSAYGRSAYDIGEDEQRMRTWSEWVADPNYERKPARWGFSVLYNFDFQGHVDSVPGFTKDKAPRIPPTSIVEYVSSTN